MGFDLEMLSSLEVNIHFKQSGLWPTKGVSACTSELFFESKCRDSWGRVIMVYGRGKAFTNACGFQWEHGALSPGQGGGRWLLLLRNKEESASFLTRGRETRAGAFIASKCCNSGG